MLTIIKTSYAKFWTYEIDNVIWVNLVFILLILLIVFLPLEHQLHDSWFVAFPVPIIVLIGRKHVPINSHLMNKDGGLVFQFQLKRKKKNQTADRCSWDRQFWLQYPGLIKSAVGKA